MQYYIESKVEQEVQSCENRVISHPSPVHQAGGLGIVTKCAIITRIYHASFISDANIQLNASFPRYLCNRFSVFNQCLSFQMNIKPCTCTLTYGLSLHCRIARIKNTRKYFSVLLWNFLWKGRLLMRFDCV